MNIVDGIVPNAELQEAAVAARNCQGDYDDLQDRLIRQREVVNELSIELRDLVIAKQWESAATSEEAADARRECFLVSERYQEEQELLTAIETAIRNTQADVSNAGNRVFRIISQIVSSQYEGAVIEGGAEQISTA
jgi:hypothetical protein